MVWTQKKVRQTFLDYFIKNAKLPHQEVSSSPIIPRDDPTLLFTNAGMNQFKSALLGEEIRDYTRACSVQKCMRVGGKHNDLDAVGKNGRHLTWFEMLGNWSFGDYGKEDTIKMAWDLSTNVFGLDTDRLYVSIYKDDEESYAIWRDSIQIDPSRIYRFGDLDKGDDENFWSMGPVGPCGPCTELFYDLGPEGGTGPEDYMGGEGDRYMEFWNNVFMQYNRNDEGEMTPLKALSVDTGMGMERMTMILQGKVSVFETDVFQPIIQRTAKRIGADWNDPQQRIDLQVIADHLRSLTFVVSEGGAFSNEGRGYVLRRILRRAVRHGRRLGFNKPFLWELAPIIGELFEGVYDLPAHIIDNTCATLKDEEARFFRTIDRGMGRIHAIMDGHQEKGSKTISGDEAFELYDTFGFPVDLTRIEAEERGFKVDESGFENRMEQQRANSRKSARFYDDDGGDWIAFEEGSGQGFAGYGLTELESHVIRYRQEGERIELILNQTPFYAESGGEIADRGRIICNQGEIEIHDVQKLNGIIHHIGTCKTSLNLSKEDRLTSYVDTEYRRKKTVHHSATHLMHAALKAIVGSHVEQQGSVVSPDRLRFDFSHKAPLTDDEIRQVEEWVNVRIVRNEPVVITDQVPLEEARSQGAMALFGEKYGDYVRTIKAGEDSFELCGGNHVQRTGDLGSFVILSESGVAAGVRRVEAVVAHSASALVQQERTLLKQACQSLKTDQVRLINRIESLQDEVKQLKKALDKARKGGGGVSETDLFAQAVEVDGVPFVAAKVDVDDRGALNALLDHLREKKPEGMYLLCGIEESGKVMLSAGAGHTLKANRRFHAGKLIGAVAPLVGGRGGGRPDFANGGGTDASQIPALLEQAPTLLADLVK